MKSTLGLLIGSVLLAKAAAVPSHVDVIAASIESIRSNVHPLYSPGLKDPQPATGKSVPLPSFNIDLTLPPDKRWIQSAAQLSNEIKNVVDYVLDLIPAWAVPVLDDAFDALAERLPTEWQYEMRGVSAGANVSYPYIVLMNLFYELDSACTSIVAEHSNGTIYHGRNLDYGIPGLNLIAGNVHFYRGNTMVYTGTTYIGYIGLLTGMRPGAFSLSIDERTSANGTILTNIVEMLFHNGRSIGFFLREVLQNETDYSAALQKLQTTPLVSVSYLIIGGVRAGEGAVVTRDRATAADTWLLDAPSRWFLVETNYDHWKPVPAHDDRRQPANQRMSASSQKFINGTYMFYDVLGRFPNLNSHTTYSVIMSAATGEYYGLIRNVP